MNQSPACFGLADGESALAVGTHPDDETLGAGGTLAKLAATGIKTHVLAILCPGNLEARTAEFNAACDAIGVTGRAVAWTSGEHASNPGAHLRELVTLIDSGPDLSVQALRPSVLLIPSATGFHQHHQDVHRACFAAGRPGGAARHTPRIVLGYAGPEDAWTTTAEHWSIYVDTTASWPAKQAALTCYDSQLRDDSHPRSLSRIRAIDTAAGAAVGTGMAERFVAYRMAF